MFCGFREKGRVRNTAAIRVDSLEEEGFEEIVQLGKQEQKCSIGEGEGLGFYLMHIFPKFLINIFGRIRRHALCLPW